MKSYARADAARLAFGRGVSGSPSARRIECVRHHNIADRGLAE